MYLCVLKTKSIIFLSIIVTCQAQESEEKEKCFFQNQVEKKVRRFVVHRKRRFPDSRRTFRKNLNPTEANTKRFKSLEHDSRSRLKKGFSAPPVKQL